MNRLEQGMPVEALALRQELAGKHDVFIVDQDVKNSPPAKRPPSSPRQILAAQQHGLPAVVLTSEDGTEIFSTFTLGSRDQILEQIPDGGS